MTDAASSSVKKPGILVVGPQPTQVGGLATFVNILLSSPSIQAKYQLIHLDTTRGARGTGLASRFAPINLFYVIRQLAELIRLRVRYGPQLLHTPMTSYWACWKYATFILTARILGMKVVAHLHGGVFDRYYRECWPPLQWAIGWIMCRSQVVIALSSWWKTFLLEEVNAGINVEIVPNTVDSTFVAALNLESERPVRDDNLILFVGELGHRKGVFEILKAAPIVLETHPSTTFLLAGAAPNPDIQAEIDHAYAETAETDRVRFLGQVTGQAKLILFLNASIFVLPSHGENMPYALLEAMGAGLPLVTTPVGAIPELVEDGVNGFLIQPGDHIALAEKIVRLLEDRSLRDSMSDANRERIRTSYTPEVAMRQFDRIYREVLGSD